MKFKFSMSLVFLVFSFFLVFSVPLYSSTSTQVQVLSKNNFSLNGKQVSFKNKKFIVLKINKNASGRWYYMNNDKLIYTGILSSGAVGYETPSGIFKIYYKVEKWMSTKYPDESGINNMDYSMFFDGDIALHKGNPKRTSHGCCHIKKQDAELMYKITEIGTPVIVTRHNYTSALKEYEQYFIKHGVRETKKNGFLSQF